MCKANIVNLSESGLFASGIKAFDLKGKKMIDEPDIVGHNFYDIKFELNGGSKRIETDGEYVRTNDANGNLGVGMRFKDLKQDYKEMIRDYIFNVFP